VIIQPTGPPLAVSVSDPPSSGLIGTVLGDTASVPALSIAGALAVAVADWVPVPVGQAVDGVLVGQVGRPLAGGPLAVGAPPVVETGGPPARGLLPAVVAAPVGVAGRPRRGAMAGATALGPGAPPAGPPPGWFCAGPPCGTTAVATMAAAAAAAAPEVTNGTGRCRGSRPR
jgi:hypothetical protein